MHLLFLPDSSEGSSDDEAIDPSSQPISREEDESEALPTYLWKSPQTTEAIGQWEAHTKVRTDDLR